MFKIYQTNNEFIVTTQVIILNNTIDFNSNQIIENVYIL